MLSLFICGPLCSVSCQMFNKQIICSELRHTSEVMVSLLEEAINSSNGFYECYFSEGPGSFTSVRVIGSIVKGIYLSDNDKKFTAISSFLTLLACIPSDVSNGTIAINTMRGDFYCMDFIGNRLLNYRVVGKQVLCHLSNVFYDIDLLSSSYNVAQLQYALVGSIKYTNNLSLVSNIMRCDYGITPQYKN